MSFLSIPSSLASPGAAIAHCRENPDLASRLPGQMFDLARWGGPHVALGFWPLFRKISTARLSARLGGDRFASHPQVVQTPSSLFLAHG